MCSCYCCWVTNNLTIKQPSYSLFLWADWAQQTALLLCDMGWGCSHLETRLIQNIQGGSLKGQPVVPAVSWELTGAMNWWPGSPSTYFSAWLGCSRLGTWIPGGSVPSGQVRSHKASYVRTHVLVIRASHRSKGRGIRPQPRWGMARPHCKTACGVGDIVEAIFGKRSFHTMLESDRRCRETNNSQQTIRERWHF